MAMSEKRDQINELLPFYQSLLTEKQQMILNWYYGEDLSLSEIGQNLAISRAAVFDSLNIGRQQLLDYEEKLHLYADYSYRMKIYQKLMDLNDSKVTSIVDDLLKKEEE